MPEPIRPDWYSFQSSFVVAGRLVGWKWIDLEFTGGFMARYYDLPDPEETFRSLLAAPSKGKWFHANLKKWPNWSKI